MNFQLHFHGQNTKTFDISSFDSLGLGPLKNSQEGKTQKRPGCWQLSFKSKKHSRRGRVYIPD